MAHMSTEEIPFAEKLRVELEKLDDRELLIEIAVNMSMAATMLQQIQNHPMLKRMFGG